MLRTAGGERLRGADACAAVNDPNREIPVQTTTPEQWTIAKNAPGCDPDVAPAVAPPAGPRWDRFFNFDYARLGFALGCTQPAREAHLLLPHEDTGGFYSNGDIRYLFTMLSRQFGEVLVIRGEDAEVLGHLQRRRADARRRGPLLVAVLDRVGDHRPHRGLPRRPPGPARPAPPVRDRRLEGRRPARERATPLRRRLAAVGRGRATLPAGRTSASS